MKLTLAKIKDEAKGTKSFFWQPEKSVTYRPGQYFNITIPKLIHPDDRGGTRDFSLSSSPTEGDLIRITTRIRPDSAFKMTLDTLKIGDTITGEGPNGSYILDEQRQGEHVLIAGGIGITPFRSMIKYNIDKKLTDIKLHLIYSNSFPEEITFRDELVEWDKSHENITVDMTITHPEESKAQWTGLTGRIDASMISRLTLAPHSLGEVGSPTYWLCGPPAMVDAMEEAINKLHIPQERIMVEKFSGY